MGRTNAKGELGEAMVFADLQRQGHGVAIPWGHDLRFDLIVVRKENRALEKSPVQYTRSDGRVVVCPGDEQLGMGGVTVTRETRTTGSRLYDATIGGCFYVPAGVWDGQVAVSLRLTPTANGQSKGIRFGRDFRRHEGDPQARDSDRRCEGRSLPLGTPPE